MTCDTNDTFVLISLHHCIVALSMTGLYILERNRILGLADRLTSNIAIVMSLLININACGAYTPFCFYTY